MNTNENLTDNEHKIIEYSNRYKLRLPKRHTWVYISIEEFPEYEYTNSIAYEMIKRNDEFKELTKNPQQKKTNDWIIKILELGLDPKINIFPDNSDFFLDTKKDTRFFYESWLSHTINDIQDGLNILINYYLNKNEIFILKDENNKNSLDSYIKTTNITINEILQSTHNYYIPCLITQDFIRMDTKGIKRMQKICNEIPLKILEKDFLNTLKHIGTKYKYTQLLPFYSKPELSFPQSNIVNIPINLNLEIEEITAYISKAKQEYQEKILIIKNPLELIGNEYDKAEKPISEEEFPDEKYKRKVAVADAFYVYDLFKILEPYFKQKSKTLRTERDDKIKDYKNEFKNTKNYKNESEAHIKELKDTYSAEINLYSKDELKRVISIISDLSLHKIERYFKYMKEYIEHKKYKELITGKKTS